MREYTKKLLDLRWKKKRIEILIRDEYTCRCCKKKHKRLLIHHINKNSEYPWDSDDNELITLCLRCHLLWHYLFDSSWNIIEIQNILDLYIKTAFLSIDEFRHEYDITVKKEDYDLQIKSKG